MNVQLPLDQMSTGEKLDLIEVIWADLESRNQVPPVSQQQMEALRERRRLIDEGKAEYVDWDVALADIRSKVRERTPSQASPG